MGKGAWRRFQFALRALIAFSPRIKDSARWSSSMGVIIIVRGGLDRNLIECLGSHRFIFMPRHKLELFFRLFHFWDDEERKREKITPRSQTFDCGLKFKGRGGDRRIPCSATLQTQSAFYPRYFLSETLRKKIWERESEKKNLSERERSITKKG